MRDPRQATSRTSRWHAGQARSRRRDVLHGARHLRSAASCSSTSACRRPIACSCRRRRSTSASSSAVAPERARRSPRAAGSRRRRASRAPHARTPPTRGAGARRRARRPCAGRRGRAGRRRARGRVGPCAPALARPDAREGARSGARGARWTPRRPPSAPVPRDRCRAGRTPCTAARATRQMARPWAIIRCVQLIQLLRGTTAISCRSAFTASRVSVSPSRSESRPQWVSTAIPSAMP